MVAFARGDTVTINLAVNDQVTMNGNAKIIITPASGSVTEENVTGTQTLGPYHQAVTLTLTAYQAGSYVVAAVPSTAAYFAQDPSGNVTGLVGSYAFPTGPYVINLELLQSSAYRTIGAKARSGIRTPILVIGDSIGFGYGSDPTPGKMRMNGLGNQVARALNGIGIKAQSQGFFGNGLGAVQSKTYDGRLSGAGLIGSGAGVSSLGGQSFLFGSAPDGPLVFTPTQNVDTFEIYAYLFGGAGSVSYSIDGGAAVPFSLNGAAGLSTITVPVALGSHNISLNYVSGAGGYILGLNAYDSSQQGFQFINASINGGLTQHFTPNTNPYDSLKIGVALAPAATMIVIGANHWNTAGSLSAFTTDLQTLIAGYSALGPVILVSDCPSNPATNASLSAQLPYVNAMRSLAASNNLLMFDMWSFFGGANAIFGSNWLNDGIHPSQQGYGLGSGWIARTLITM